MPATTVGYFICIISPCLRISSFSFPSSFAAFKHSSFPHGRYTFIPIVFALAALGCTLTVLCSCRYVILDRGDKTLEEYCIGKEDFCPVAVGFLRGETVESCAFYEPDDTAEFDNKYWAARSLTVLTAVLGLVSATFVSCTVCVAYDFIGFICFAIFFILCAIFSGLSLLVLSSNVCLDVECFDTNGTPYACATCKLSTGGILAIVAGLLWALAAIVITFTPEAKLSRDLGSVRPSEHDDNNKVQEEDELDA